MSERIPNQQQKDRKRIYIKPKVLASYSKEDLEALLKPEGIVQTYIACSGCGGG